MESVFQFNMVFFNMGQTCLKHLRILLLILLEYTGQEYGFFSAYLVHFFRYFSFDFSFLSFFFQNIMKYKCIIPLCVPAPVVGFHILKFENLESISDVISEPEGSRNEAEKRRLTE